MKRVRVPSDIANVLELYRQLGHAARKGLWISEIHTKKEIQDAALAASRLARHSQK